jgi:uncharacterized RDD family membrane protein YckC
MSEFLIGLIGVNLFILFAPFILLHAAFFGNEDEQEIMRWAFWVAFPFTVCFWYMGLRLFLSFWRGFFEGIRMWKITHGSR